MTKYGVAEDAVLPEKLLWGDAFLALRNESCYRCSGRDIFFGAYMWKDRNAESSETWGFLPVCKLCTKASIMSLRREPVFVHWDIIGIVAPHLTEEQIATVRKRCVHRIGMARKLRLHYHGYESALRKGARKGRVTKTLNKSGYSAIPTVKLSEVLTMFPGPNDS